MAFSKLYDTPDAAVADLWDGATILIGGAASQSEPKGLLAALLRHHATNLTVVGDFSELDRRGAMLELLRSGRVARAITPFGVVADDDGNDSMMQELSGVELVAVSPGHPGRTAARRRSGHRRSIRAGRTGNEIHGGQRDPEHQRYRVRVRTAVAGRILR